MAGEVSRMSNMRYLILLLAIALAGVATGCEDQLADGLPGYPDCSACHGDETSSAPPKGLNDEIATSRIEVGAHRSHLTDGELRKAIDCDECHVVPGTVGQEGHIDPKPADLTFGDLSTANGVTPTWDRTMVRCVDTYCHGTTLGGGTNKLPIWNRVGLGEAACGTCHGSPPPPPHVGNTDCNQCHPATVTANGEIDVEGGYHINGVVEVSGLACNTCHGNDDNAAPPVSVEGSSDTSDVDVGAHQAHLGVSDWHNEIVCEDCHVVPTAVDDPGHIDDPPAELTWSALAEADLATPTWDPDAETCTGTYCHGTTLYTGGSLTEPVWTTVDDTQAACGTCHSLPPNPPHPVGSSCGSCHGDVINTDSTWADPDRHIDGNVDVNLACNSCHGSVDNDAPPLDTNGNSDDTLITVGAHQSHLGTSDWHNEIVCQDCHIVPATVGDPGHIDTAPAELTWSALAEADLATPIWDPGGETCTGTYCHGTTLFTGGSLTEPVWTTVDDTQTACGTCHSLPPGPPHPVAAYICGDCHGDVFNTDWTWADPDRHIDGNVDVNLACNSCHGAPPNTGAHLVHYGAMPADASYGGTGMTQDLLPGNTAYAFDCGNCHPLLLANHGNGVPNSGGGTAEVDLSPVGAPPASIKAMHLGSATYTPGGTTFLDTVGFTFTLGTCADVYCHSELTVDVPGPVDEPVSAAPGPGEFLFTTYPIDYYPAYTETFGRAYATPAWNSSFSCDGCHGFPPRTADPAVLAGAGDGHSWIDDQNYENLHGWNMGWDPLACATCHYDTTTDQGVRTRDLITDWSIYQPVAIDGFVNHVDGQPDVIFTTDNITYNSTFNLAAAAYNDVTETCSNVSCHLNDTTTVWGRPYRWWNNVECNSCHQY